MFNPTEWLQSGQDAVVAGLPLRPRPHPSARNIVLAASMGQAAVYFLDGDRRREWMLKKFHPGRAPDPAYVGAIRALIPRAGGFEAGWERRCLAGAMVSSAGYTSPEFLEWIDGTILMPRVQARAWSDFLSDHRDGLLDLDGPGRAAVAEDLCLKVQTLEKDGLAHRDLSATNVMIGANGAIHLIDWDSMFAADLAMPANTTIGTNGYIAPFVREAGDDPDVTWSVGADRFALAVLVLETFAAQTGCALSGDGGLLDQDEIHARSGATLDATITAAEARTTDVPRLFAKALAARGPAECPAPSEWLRVVHRTRRSARRPVTSAAAPHFVRLSSSVFVRLDSSRFVTLSSQ